MAKARAQTTLYKKATVGGRNLLICSKNLIHENYNFTSALESQLTDEKGNVLTDENGNVLTV